MGHQLTLSFFEHERREFPWEQHHLDALGRLNEALGTEVLSANVYYDRRVLKASSYVGVVRIGRDTFQILPKISYGSDEEQSATRNLLYLLEQVGDFPVRQHDLAPLLQRGENWFEILTRLFAAELKVQCQQGLHRHYQVIDEVSTALKGKWQISQQIRQPLRPYLFDVSYDEFTNDNQLNRVFRFVVECLWERSRNHATRRILDELRQWLGEVTYLPIVTAEMAAPNLITRLNYRFEPLLNLARLFLAGSTIEMSVGTTNSFAFVFDMNQLFESFITSFINRYRDQILPSSLQDCTLHSQAQGYTRHLAYTDNGKNVFRLKPDLAVRSGNKFLLLLDTKYKKLDSGSKSLGISQDDFYQMFAYAHRYECSRVILLYPQIDKPIRAHFSLPDSKIIISAASANLHRELSGKHGRNGLIEELKQILNKETSDVHTA